MMYKMRTKRGAPLSKVVLAIALGAGRHHAMAHAHGHHHLSSGGTAGHTAAPVSTPPRYKLENGGGAGGRACAALGGRAVYDLMALCHENGWRLVPDGDDRYVVTTGRSAAAGGKREHLVVRLPSPRRAIVRACCCRTLWLSDAMRWDAMRCAAM